QPLIRTRVCESTSVASMVVVHACCGRVRGVVSTMMAWLIGCAEDSVRYMCQSTSSAPSRWQFVDSPVPVFSTLILCERNPTTLTGAPTKSLTRSEGRLLRLFQEIST